MLEPKKDLGKILKKVKNQEKIQKKILEKLWSLKRIEKKFQKKFCAQIKFRKNFRKIVDLKKQGQKNSGGRKNVLKNLQWVWVC